MSNEKIYVADLKDRVYFKLKNLKKQKPKRRGNFHEEINSCVIKKIKEVIKNAQELAKYKNGLNDTALIESLSSKNFAPSVFSLTYTESRALENFLFTQTKPINRNLDIFSIFIGYYGYRDFLKNHIPSEKFNLENSPLDVEALSTFFKNPCYVYAFDEDMVRNDSEGYVKKAQFPQIDALKLVLNKDNKTFELENRDNKRIHRKGVISWCKEFKDDNNAFDIHFLESSTQLILRFHFPYTNYEEIDDRDINLFCGAFMFCRVKGHVAVGTVIVYNGFSKDSIEPFSYSFEDFNDNRIPDTILKYLYDRQQNWIKIPYNIYNLKQFERWREDQHSKNYTYNQIKERDFLIFHPNFSIQGNFFKDFKKKIRSFCEEPSKILKEENLKGIEDIKAFYAYFQTMYNTQRIEIHDMGRKINNGNAKLIKKISRTSDLVFVIPNLDLSPISSIFTAIGYGVALKKNCYIFYQSGVKLPKMLSENETDTKIFIYQYSRESEIPNLLIKYGLKDKWNERILRRAKKIQSMN